MAQDEERVEVTRNAGESRYEIHVDGSRAGVTDFHADDQGRLVFDHTVVEKEFGGRGLGGVLVGRAMTDVAARGETVVPECSFVAKYLSGRDVPGLTIAWPDEAPAE